MEAQENLLVSKEKSEEKVKIKINAYCVPAMKWDAKAKEYKAVALTQDLNHEMLKLLDEEGDTPEETANLKRLHTRLYSRLQVAEYIGARSAKQCYYKDEIVTLSKKEAEYYLNNFCGGEVMLPNEDTHKTNKFEKSHYKRNIDGRCGAYKASELARYKREHVPVPLAELI